MFSAVISFIINNYSSSLIFFNFIKMYFYFNIIMLMFFIFFTAFSIYYIYSNKKISIFFSQFLINSNKIINFFFLIFDLILILFFKKIYIHISKPLVIINFSFYNFFESSSFFSIKESFFNINSYFFEFSISNIQLFFIFLSRLIFFYVANTFKYTDTNNFIYKSSFSSFTHNSHYFTLIFFFS